MYQKCLVALYGLMLIYIVTAQDSINTICIMNYSCVSISHCQADSNIHYPCGDRQTRVCCPPESVLDITNQTNTVDEIRKRLLPERCGIVSSTDRITGGQIASIGQFPWMALLGYKQAGIDVPQFLCGGSIISDQFILTAAHCVNIDSRLSLHVIRLGELNLETDIDCEQGVEVNVCADKYEDVSIDSTVVHELFDANSLENDIALIKLKTKIANFTEYIQPVCLPVTNDIKYKTTPNNKLTVSGWGKINSGNIGGSPILQFTDVRLWNHTQCNASVPSKIRPIKDSQICANGARQQDACKGDSGGPLINNTVIDGDILSYQVGIVSFASARICGNAELPTIYTKVEYYIDWIINNIT